MKKTLLAATSLLALVAFGANASEEAAKHETTKHEAATTEAAKPADATTEAAKTAEPAAGEVKKEEKKEEAK